MVDWIRFVLRLPGAWLLLVSLALPSGRLAAADAELVLNATPSEPYTTPAGDGFYDIIVGRAIRGAGYSMRLVRLPAERALMLANSGQIDGELARVPGIEKLYPNLVPVPENVLDWHFTAFARDATIPGDFAAIRARGAGLIRGWKIYERAMAGATRVVQAEGPEQLFRMLQLGRVEVALYERDQGETLAQRMGVAGVHSLTPPLATTPSLIYLNRKHAAAVVRIGAALRAMKQDGTYDRVLREKLPRRYARSRP